MIYQPRNVQPSSSAIDGTSQDILFSMEIQTNSYVSAYSLVVSDFNNTPVYTINKTTLTDYLYNGDVLEIPIAANQLVNGKNYKWRVRLYQPAIDMIITYGYTQATSTTTNIYLQSNINIKDGMSLSIGGEIKTISTYNADTGLAVVSSAFTTAPTIGTQYYIYSDFIETTPDFIVYARALPTVAISNVPSTLTLKYHTFQGTYNQTDSVPMVYHQFDLYVGNSDGTKTLIDTTGKIYSANLTYEYDGFRTGETYYIQMTTENDFGIISTTSLYSFNVSYQIIEYLQQPTAVFDKDTDGIKVSWMTPVEHDAELIDPDTQQSAVPVYLYNTPYNPVNSLYLNGYNASWESTDGLCGMPTDFNISFQFSPDSDFFYDNGAYSDQVTFFEGTTDDDEEEGSFTISIDGNKLVFFQEPSTTLEAYFYTGTTQVFVNSSSSVPQINNDYVWLDSGTWADSGYWVEGGTPLARICGHWWKAQITNTEIRVEEIYPST